MTWQRYLIDWKNDKSQPMTHEEVDRDYAIGSLERGRMILKHTHLDVKDKKTLDVGIGSGGIACAFAEKGALIYGLDVNDYFINMSKQRFKDLNLKYERISKWKGGGFRIPYPDKFFDAIIATDTLHHAPKWKVFIKEINRVLKTNGYLFISEERRWFPFYVLQSPHDNLPFTMLLPKSIRVKIEKRIGMPTIDYYMFSFSWELRNELRKYLIKSKNIDSIKKEAFNKKHLPKIVWPIYNLMFIQMLCKKSLALEKLSWDAIPP
jgi:ubiquinone/menaquinone biosynthesis C-methylase UbiE